MTCRCSSPAEHAARAQSAAYDSSIARAAELASRTPNPDSFEIEEVEPVGEHLVMKVKYPSCAKCAFEGSKVMVFLDVTLKIAIKWRRIDPHFRSPGMPSTLPAKQTEAPSPAARFPASRDGWCDAVAYANGKAR